MTQAPPEPSPSTAAVANPGKGLSIAGLVLGIVAVALFCVWYLAIPCAIVGLILSIIARNKSKAANAPTGMATAGLILCIIALVLDVVLGIVLGSLILGAVGMTQEMQRQMMEQSGSSTAPASNLAGMLRLLL
ncbi:MAG: hypothetical protein J7M21_06020 [Planctomycetes bacterium]|nr:hypothetical protein [Planctomycetota bacterium]